MSTYSDTTASIYRMAYKRLAKGETIENVIQKLDHYKANVWKNSPDIKAYIDSITEELKELQQIPEEAQAFILPYAVKYWQDRTKDKYCNISDEYFDVTFADCALPLNKKFYPMLRLLIFKQILKDTKEVQ